MTNNAARTAGRPRKKDAFLDLKTIVDAAWILVEREGVTALKTRRLADELGVKSPALYWYIPSMQALHSQMVERMLTESIRTPEPNEAWEIWLEDVGQTQRRNFMSHRDSGRIIAFAPPTETTRNEVLPMLMAPLIAAGFQPNDAVAAAGTFASFLLGWVIYEQNSATHDHITSLVDLDTAFSFGLGAIIAGLQEKGPK